MQMVDLFKRVPGHLPLWDIVDTDAGLSSCSAPVSMVGPVSAMKVWLRCWNLLRGQLCQGLVSSSISTVLLYMPPCAAQSHAL